MSQSSGGYLRFCTSGYDPRGSQQSLIAKILQSRPIFCFWTPRRPRTNTAARIGWSRFRKQDRVVAIPRAGWGGHDAAGRMGQSQRRGQGGPAAASWARLIGRTALKTQKEWRAFPFHSYVGTRCFIEARSTAGIYKRLEYHSLRMVFLP